MSTPNDSAYREVKKLLAKGEQLTFPMIGDIFGQDFWVILVYTLMDANDAARAIQGAILRIAQETYAEHAKAAESASQEADAKPLIVAG